MGMKITIKSEVLNRMSPPGKNGQVRQIFWQDAQLETENLRMQFDYEVDGPAFALPVGKVMEWDIEADVIPGRYGPELARRKTLREIRPAAAVKTA